MLVVHIGLVDLVLHTEWPIQKNILPQNLISGPQARGTLQIYVNPIQEVVDVSCHPVYLVHNQRGHLLINKWQKQSNRPFLHHFRSRCWAWRVWASRCLTWTAPTRSGRSTTRGSTTTCSAASSTRYVGKSMFWNLGSTLERRLYRDIILILFLFEHLDRQADTPRSTHFDIHGTIIITRFHWDIVVCLFACMSVCVYKGVRYQNFGLSHACQIACILEFGFELN